MDIQHIRQLLATHGTLGFIRTGQPLGGYFYYGQDGNLHVIVQHGFESTHHTYPPDKLPWFLNRLEHAGMEIHLMV